MLGRSMGDKEFVKLSHFDRVRRGYLEKIPTNFVLIGVLIGLNFFQFSNAKTSLIMGILMFVPGLFLKYKMIERDDNELNKHSRKIEHEYQERLKTMER